MSVAALAETKPAKTTAGEIWELKRHRDTVRGTDQQYQVNPLLIYDELRPAPYRDNPNPTTTKGWTGALSCKIKCDAGLDGFYGPIDKEAAVAVDEQHVIASQSPAVCPLAEYLTLKMQSYYYLEKNASMVRNAHLALPDAPGYGIELDPARAEAQEQMHWGVD